ncbi:MAG: class I SAM-dependent methyltransferase [Pirellulales bacterium]
MNAVAGAHEDAMGDKLDRKIQADFYDQRWSGEITRHNFLSAYDRPRVTSIVQNVVLRFDELGHLKVLDLGCGNGWLTRFLAPFATVSGIDLSPEGIRQASERYPDHRFAVGSLFDEDIFDEQFDVVVCHEVLEHVDTNKQLELIQVCRRRLVRNGLLVLTTPNKWAQLHRRKALGLNTDKLGDQPLENMLSVLETRSLIRQAFQIQQIYTVINVPFKHGLARIATSGRLQRTIPGWKRLPYLLNMGMHIVVVGQRD